MATFQSRHALRQQPAVQAYVAGVTITQVFEFDMASQAVNTGTDRIEMGMLPAGAQLVGATLIGTAGIGVNTANVGVMSGEFGSNDNARTVGSQLFSGANINGNETQATRANCLAVTPTDNHRSLGITVSANITAGANKKLTLVVEYVFN